MKKWQVLMGASLFGALLVGAAAVTSTNVSAASKKLAKVEFVLDWTPNTNHTGLYVAQQKGYFKDAGLDVKIVQPSDGDASTIVASGKAQFGITAQDSIAAAYAKKDPLPVTNIAAIIQHNTSGIVSRKGDGITTPKGLEGKTYATWDSPIEQAMIKDVMQKDGGDFSKVKLIPNNIEDEPAALKQKQADAIWIFYGWGGINAGIEKVPIDYFAFKDLNPTFDYYTPTIIGNNSYLKKHPALAKKFMAATTKGYEYAIKHPTKSANILLKEVPELDKNLVQKSQAYLSKQYKADASQWGVIDGTRWNAFYTWLNDNNLVKNKLAKDTGFTNEYLPKD